VSSRPCSSSSNTLVEIGEGDGETLLSGLLARSEAPSLAHLEGHAEVIEGIFKTLEEVRAGLIADVG